MGVLAKYRQYLPLTERTPMISLEEGSTPLVHAPRLGRELGCDQLYLKLEGCNPTGSFKDRGMVVAVAKAAEEGAQGVICASTGNTSASAAAYAARVGLPAVVLVPEGNIALGKLAQAIIYGASVLAIDGSFDQALRIVRAMGEEGTFAIVNSINPYRIEGQKTAAFEVSEQLGRAPDILAIPVGNAGNITAYWKGFKEAHDRGMTCSLPRMLGFQAEGAAPIVRGKVVEHPQTVATAIRIGNPASWRTAEAARDESGGRIDAVSDEEILAAYRRLAQWEGVFGEPASAASVAGLWKLVKSGQLDLAGKTAVCIITGSGLKDPDRAVKAGEQVYHLPADEGAIRRWLADLGKVT
ncbi:MAG: threonine synthase [Chloroflexi bacterium]|nr:threonine synthase [Chloroflexota bacterium]MCL5025423.1 threonine synthase [Chloroflexota bacterium]